jgi:general secretion pathway protein D
MKIIERMDESGDEPIEVIPLHSAGATELVRTVSQLNQGTGGAEAGSTSIKIIADERTNSVLISGEKSLRLRAKALVLDLDTPRRRRRRPAAHRTSMPASRFGRMCPPTRSS